MKNRIISPSLLSANFTRLKEDIKKVEVLGVNRLHLDIMDGHFVPNLTFGPFIINDIRQITKSHLETHLMIENPHKYLADYIKAGSDTLIIHYEASNNIKKDLTYIRDNNVLAGIAINPDTSPGNIEKFLHNIDSVLVMTVHPGFGGQQFIDSQLEKIKNIRKQIDASERDIDLAVDGGVSAQNAASIVQAGANVLVAGTAVFAGRRDNYHENIAALRGAA